MTGGWSREHIDRVREATDIVAVIGEHVQLKKAGRVFKGLCPFHKEKTPSFVVNPERNIYKCFGCGEGGDVYRFLMESEHLSFPEAVELLAGRAGITLPRRRGPQNEESVYPALEWASGWYRERLESPAGKGAREYLKQRGLAPDTWHRFGLGFAPPGWSNLMDRSRNRFTTALLERAGLLSSNDEGHRYDRFRGRLMIPIRSALGKTLGFGARSLGSEEPKYLNSPETEAFVKGRVLYGLSEAKEAFKETRTALVVEGYMDVIALAQSGFTHAVGACGTALTEDQARILRRYVDKAVLIFDGDAAGRRAAWKACGIFLSEGFDTRVLTLPEGEDPDSAVRSMGAEAFGQTVENAPGVVDYARKTLSQTLKREEILKAFAYLGARMDDRIRRSVLLEEAAEAFRFELETLQRETGKLLGEGRSTRARAPEKKDPKDVPGRAFITLLLMKEDMSETARLPESVFQEPRLQALYRRMGELWDEHPEGIKNRLMEDAQFRDFTAELLADDSLESVEMDYVAARLKGRLLKKEAESVRAAIRDAEIRGDDEAVMQLARERQRIAAEMRRLGTAARKE